MYALSRDGATVFLHQPDAGMMVPMLLDLRRRELSVRVPSVVELENDYAVFDEFEDILEAVGRPHHDQLSFARKFSQECSKAYRDQLSSGDLTIGTLRRLVDGDLRRAASSDSRLTETREPLGQVSRSVSAEVDELKPAAASIMEG